MSSRPAKSLTAYLLSAELGAVLLGSAPAMGEDRIALEVMGAVRMANAEEVRRADAERRVVETRTVVREAPARAAPDRN